MWLTSLPLWTMREAIEDEQHQKQNTGSRFLVIFLFCSKHRIQSRKSRQEEGSSLRLLVYHQKGMSNTLGGSMGLLRSLIRSKYTREVKAHTRLLRSLIRIDVSKECFISIDKNLLHLTIGTSHKLTVMREAQGSTDIRSNTPINTKTSNHIKDVETLRLIRGQQQTTIRRETLVP